MATPARSHRQKHPIRRFGVLAAAATLTACGVMAGPVAMEAHRLPSDPVPTAEPSESSAALQSVTPSRAAASAPGSVPKQSVETPRAAAPSAAAPRAAAPSAAAPRAAAESAAPRPAPELRAAEQPAGEPLAGQPTSTDPLHKMPRGDLPGWKQVFREEFNKGDVPIGAFPGPLYSAKWSAGYKDGTPDTAGQMGAKSGYYPSKVLSVKNGMLDWYLHTKNGISMGAAPSPKIPNNSAQKGLLPRHNSLMYGRISVRFKADSLRGFKVAWLLWPDSGVWPRDGEIDFPEGDLSKSFYGAVHKRGNDPKATDVFRSHAFYVDWHVATMEWSPGKVEFFLDGRSLGAGTTATPTTPMHYILQTESCLPICPSPQTTGHVYLDWIAIWKRA